MLTGKEILMIQESLILRGFLRHRDLVGVAGWCKPTADAYSRYMQLTHGKVPVMAPLVIQEVPASLFEGLDLSHIVEPSLVVPKAKVEQLPVPVPGKRILLTPKKKDKSIIKKSLRPEFKDKELPTLKDGSIPKKSKDKGKNKLDTKEKTSTKSGIKSSSVSPSPIDELSSIGAISPGIRVVKIL
jgi:hypothetical protein